MAFLQFTPPQPSLHLPSLFPRCPSLPRNFIIFPNPLLKSVTRPTISILPLSPPNALPTTDQEILDAIAHSDQGDDEKKKNLPCLRTYENDLARLTVIGDVAFEQALTAAAADGGDAAEEHIDAGMSTMAVETIFPGALDDHSTVSTRLFLPARKVKEKANKLQSTLTADILSNTTSRNILAMTFRQVILHHLWSFELALFSPGSERNMEDLANPREVSAFFTLSSPDRRFLSVLAEVVCLCALESTERDFFANTRGMTSSNGFPWFQKPKRIASSDSSVIINKIPQEQVVENARNLVENINSKKGKYIREMKRKNGWWAPPTYSRLDKMGGPEFSSWTNEHVPAYRLQINVENFKNVKFEGWQRSVDNRWEVLLTHFQMVGLANILDIYYEDQYTIPGKQLSCGLAVDFSKLSKSKSSLWKMISVGLAGGCILVSFSIAAQFCWPQLFKPRGSPKEHCTVTLSEVGDSHHQSLGAAELEALCVSVIKKIKDALGWPGDIMTDQDVGAWSGQLPSYLIREKSNSDLVQDAILSTTKSNGDVPTHAGLSYGVASSSLESSTNSNITTAQDIASYQVVVSRDGKIIGFQPMSRLAVNHWASNPLAKTLYGRRKISPGLIEPRLKIPRPDEAIQLELLMSVNPEFWFALARPVP